MQPSIYIILDTRRMKKKTENFPVKLRVSFEREYRDFQTVFGLESQEEFEKLKAKHINAELVKIRDAVNKLEADGRDYAATLDPFTFSDFELGFVRPNKLFKTRALRKVPDTLDTGGDFDYGPYLAKFPILQQQHSSMDAISVVYVSVVRTLLRQGRAGSAETYQNSYNSLKAFRGDCTFKSITVSYLREFEQWHRAKGNSKGYVGILLRHLRAVFNEADRAKVIVKAHCYPFGPGKYVIPSKKKIKEPLETADIAHFYFAPIEDEGIKEAIDYWMFLYQGNGMNPKDMALLRWSDWVGGLGGTITFERAKTQLTAREDVLPITVTVTEDMARIIETRGNKERTPEGYIFPFLRPEMNPLEVRLAIKKLAKSIRERMIRAFKILKIDKKSSPQQARYACLNHLREAWAPTPVIQAFAGHEHPETTESYFAAVKDATKAKFAKVLTGFKNGEIAGEVLNGSTFSWLFGNELPEDEEVMVLFRNVIARVGLKKAKTMFGLAASDQSGRRRSRTSVPELPAIAV